MNDMRHALSRLRRVLAVCHCEICIYTRWILSQPSSILVNILEYLRLDCSRHRHMQSLPLAQIPSNVQHLAAITNTLTLYSGLRRIWTPPRELLVAPGTTVANALKLRQATTHLAMIKLVLRSPSDFLISLTVGSHPALNITTSY